MSPPAAPRLAALRARLKDMGLDGFVVPHEDAFQGEYLPPSDERLAWLTGFTGSAGAAVILAGRAALFTDGRYTVQARAQVDATAYEFLHSVENPPTKWLAEVLRGGERIGFDPWLHTPAGVARLREACGKAGADMVAVDGNPIDALWADRPPPNGSALIHPEVLAGRSGEAKRIDLAAHLVAEQAHAVFLSAADSVCWLFNIRGSDVPFTPLLLAFAVVRADGRAILFADPGRIPPEVARHLGAAVEVRPPEALGPALDALGANGKRVLADPAGAPQWVFDRLERAGATVVRAADPCLLPKACKTPAEMEEMRAAHRRDGVALAGFFSWLDARLAAGETVRELACIARLEEFRRRADSYLYPSFAAIVGSGPHGAIVHYRADEASDRVLGQGELLLIDSGGQYRGGTTDVTRTLAVGRPSAEMIRRFTQVLKGHIAVARARFPVGTTGGQLDTLARLALWEDGVDYDHGTGHGVGAFLSVHEGPQRISKRGGDPALKPGMVLSNEPGYYKEGAFGIRIENLIAVVDAPRPEGAEKDLLAFDPLTLAPIDRRLIDPAMLSAAERAWLNAYHARVRDEIAPLLDDPAERRWLIAATEPI